jgi:SAM-dependent methyltransferase
MANFPQVFDRSLYLARQAHANSEALHMLDTRIAEDLHDRFSLITRNFETALLLAPRPQTLLQAFATPQKFGRVVTKYPQDGDNLQLTAKSFSAIVSVLDLHAINDVPGYMAQLANALQPDGLAVFVFFAGETLRELREAWLAAEQAVSGGASPRVAPMIDLKEAGGLLQRAGLALPVADVDRATLRYTTPLALMREIKSCGLANCLHGRARTFASKRLLIEATTRYPLDADGRISTTVEIAWALAWKPHPSQQQPLKPGSAKARLADALNVNEIKL